MEYRNTPITGTSYRETADSLESVMNLIYLAKVEADRPERVREYMDRCAERMQHIVNFIGRGA